MFLQTPLHLIYFHGTVHDKQRWANWKWLRTLAKRSINNRHKTYGMKNLLSSSYFLFLKKEQVCDNIIFFLFYIVQIVKWQVDAVKKVLLIRPGQLVSLLKKEMCAHTILRNSKMTLPVSHTVQELRLIKREYAVSWDLF